MEHPQAPPTSGPKGRRAVLMIALALLLITASVFLTGRQDPGTFIVTFPSGTELITDVADTPEKIFFGLAFRDHLPEDRGMVYIFDSSDRHRLTTKGFMVPVDMIWLDESKYVVHTVTGAEPCDERVCPQFGPPPENARYVVQTVAGFVETEGIKPGDVLKFTLRL